MTADTMSNTNSPASELFTVRVWQETLSAEVVEPRFQVTHVLSGETRIFREGNVMVDYLTATTVNRQERSA